MSDSYTAKTCSCQGDPVASVIILAYKQEATIGRAIESVLNQDCKYPYEIVVADDGSPDNTRMVAERYAERFPERVRMLPLLPNRGLVSNYFDAMEKCRGRYISDCAGDDEWLDTHRLQKQIDTLEANPALTSVFTDVEECVVDGDGRTHCSLHSSRPGRNRYMRPILKGRDALIGVLNNTTELPYTLSAALYRKSALMKVYGEHRDIVRCEDVGVEDIGAIAALASQGDAAFLPIVGYRYYIDGESISNNLSYRKEFNLFVRITRESYRLSNFYGIDKSYLKDHIKSKLNHIAAQADHEGDIAMLATIEECRKMWNVRYPLKAKVHLMLLQLKNILKKNKN